MGKLTTKGVQKLVKESNHGMTNDGDGLYLKIGKGGGASWIYRFRWNGRLRDMGLGSYADKTLSNARESAAENRKLVKQGIDPLAVREQKNEKKSVTVTVTHCAARYIQSHRRSWRNAKHARQWVSTLKTYVRPVIGNLPVEEVTTQDILKILTPIWTVKNETAKRVQGRIENILDFAAAHEYRDQVNPARWRGHLDKLLAKPSRVQKVNHHPAMPYDQVATFIGSVQLYKSMSSKALLFLILTATRTSEVLNAEWKEIDIGKATWQIPAERMKANREHRVPLSKQAIDLLLSLSRVKGNSFIFPGMKAGRPLSNMSLLQFMRGLGYGPSGEKGNYVPHGFRSSFRDWTGEVTSYPRDVAEMALAHAIENKVEAAYRRGDLFEKRRAMMQHWADYTFLV
ncbi:MULTISPECIES: tyrosine-type recombinase/integrase [Halomonadaceae]|jgi:integrase|uniref:Prophage integrase IntA n=1 Tax=Vreelandella titanicae TaxID=664683 RepID=A0AAP9T0J0_9GAMM|nr:MULTISPECIES: integrase arm-type DNA-binding domain-containing protein [Halomonas]QKS23571.1 Prophage integrase IntA [Halomonas titanicae]TDV87747.1 integrase [Halomonas alkaliantarctica]CDG55188.1 Phage integrase [Halomonas sp. A3H3]SDI36863.1 Integrase [Halomonas titanicae]|tara:strand:+ start:241 stop:1437 length:1197 start_codon:yes stop_codon:yes gene_type:complete